MSLCRWSSNNWACDLYCYYDCSGDITIHVAGKRYTGKIPKVPDILEVSSKEYMEAHRKQMAFLKKAERKPIGLPEDGNTFNVGNIAEFREKLKYLRKLGYNFPDYLFQIDEE